MKQFISKNIYKWHRIIGVLTIIPVIFWCLSGLMHPFLSHWFKPKIANELFIPKPLNVDQLTIPLKKVLEQNNIKTFKNFRIIQFSGNTFYQVKNSKNEWLYFNTQTGIELNNGDKIYAEYLARYFLADSTSKIRSITLQTNFSQQYKWINRLLPIWKVSFDRSDNMDVYVETPYSRLGTFNPNSRKIFLWVFDNFHNWTFLEKISNNTLRIAIMILFLSVICISSLSGIVIYCFMWGKFKKPNPENKKGILRVYHRQIGISVAFVSLTFAFSGAYHATMKLEPNILPQMIYEPTFNTQELPDSLLKDNINWSKIVNLSYVKIDSILFYQIFYQSKKGKNQVIDYVNTKDNSVWQEGNSKYAIYLANYFKESCMIADNNNCCEIGAGSSPSSKQKDVVLKTDDVPFFEKREYGFAFKRLPVVRVSYNTDQKTNLYIETTTSRLAAKIENTDRYEGFSFAILHKFLFMDWAGKNIRDIVMMLSALGVLTVSIFGLVLFLKNKK
jgi:hypothetical protein